MQQTIRFDDQVAVVTGAGRGLGRAYAVELARRGAKVVVNDVGAEPDGSGRSSSAAEATAREIVESGGQAVPSAASVATAQGGEEIIGTALDSFGRVDILINNAGILRDKSFVKMAADDFNLLLDVHLKGAFFVTQPAFKAMKDRGYGRILFTTSGAGLWGNFGQANYAAAKMGLVGLSGTIAIEGARCGINSNVIAPIARTRLTDALMPAQMGPHAPEQVAALALYLVSQQCAVSHEVFTAGAGWFSRVFIGATRGWTEGPEAVPTIEAVAEHMDQICDDTSYEVPADASGVYSLMASVAAG